MTVQDDIVILLGSGMLLSEILELDDMPSRQTIYRWLREDAEFAEQYELARTMAADVIDEEIHRLANAITPETASATRVQIEALKWRCSKLHPLRYAAPASAIVENNVASNTNVSVLHNLTDAQLSEMIAALSVSLTPEERERIDAFFGRHAPLIDASPADVELSPELQRVDQAL